MDTILCMASIQKCIIYCIIGGGGFHGLYSCQFSNYTPNKIKKYAPYCHCDVLFGAEGPLEVMWHWQDT